jgi:hypothetical protein
MRLVLSQMTMWDSNLDSDTIPYQMTAQITIKMAPRWQHHMSTQMTTPDDNARWQHQMTTSDDNARWQRQMTTPDDNLLRWQPLCNQDDNPNFRIRWKPKWQSRIQPWLQPRLKHRWQNKDQIKSSTDDNLKDMPDDYPDDNTYIWKSRRQHQMSIQTETPNDDSDDNTKWQPRLNTDDNPNDNPNHHCFKSTT